MMTETSFAPPGETRIEFLLAARDPLRLGDVSGDGITRSVVSISHKLSFDSAEGVGEADFVGDGLELLGDGARDRVGELRLRAR